MNISINIWSGELYVGNIEFVVITLMYVNARMVWNGMSIASVIDDVLGKWVGMCSPIAGPAPRCGLGSI